MISMRGHLGWDRKIIIIVASVAGIVLLIFGFVFLYFIPRTESGVKRHYNKQLAKLNTSIKEINKDIARNQEPKEALASYDKKLKDVSPICKKIISRHKQTAGKKYSAETRQSIDGANKLCGDLLPVIAYSRQLYSTLKPYMLYGTDSWPAYDNAEFTGKLSEAQGLIKTTQANLEKINYPQIEDPALGELLVQIKSADKVGDDAYKAAAKGEATQSQELAERLRKDMRQDKADFLSARQYFWQNTVQSDALLQALEQLQNNIKN